MSERDRRKAEILEAAQRALAWRTRRRVAGRGAAGAALVALCWSGVLLARRHHPEATVVPIVRGTPEITAPAPEAAPKAAGEHVVVRQISDDELAEVLKELGDGYGVVRIDGKVEIVSNGG